MKEYYKSNKKKYSSYKAREEFPHTKISSCIICNKYFAYVKKLVKCCSPECLSASKKFNGRKGGKISSGKKLKRSKDEIKLYDLCKSHFNKVTHNECLFNGWDADILIYDIKTAILWNGAWHYKEMPGLTHSLKQVKNRDSIKIKEIENQGWKCIIFEDRYYTPQQAFDLIK